MHERYLEKVLGERKSTCDVSFSSKTVFVPAEIVFQKVLMPSRQVFLWASVFESSLLNNYSSVGQEICIPWNLSLPIISTEH